MYSHIYNGCWFDVLRPCALIKTTSAQSKFWKGYGDEEIMLMDHVAFTVI